MTALAARRVGKVVVKEVDIIGAVATDLVPLSLCIKNMLRNTITNRNHGLKTLV